MLVPMAARLRHHAEIRLIHDHFVLFDLNFQADLHQRQKTSGMLYRGDLFLAGVNLVFMQDAHSAAQPMLCTFAPQRT
jgi:hypothetical protein